MTAVLEFHLSHSNARAAQFFRSIGAQVVESNKLCAVGYKYHQYGPEYWFPTIKVKLTPELQEALSVKSGIDVTGFLQYFGLGAARSKKDAARAINRNNERWDAIKPKVLEVLSQITLNNNN